MHENLVKIQLKNFTTLRNWELDSELPANCLFDCVNSEFDGGIWKSIPGTTAYLPALTGGTVVNGLFYYPYKLSDLTDKDLLVEYYDKKFYLIDAALDTRTLVPATTFTVDEELDAVNYNNDIYLISPTNGMGYITGGATWGADFAVRAAYVTGGTNAPGNFALWTSITNGSFRIEIDGTWYNITGINFTGYSSMDTIAGKIQLEIRTVTGGMETVIWETDHFIITSGAIPASSSISLTTAAGVGTDISGEGAFSGLACSSGFGTVTLVSIPPTGSMIETLYEKMWTAGDPLNRNLLTYSRSATANNPEYIRDYTNGSGKALVGSGGAITAIRRLKNTLYVFKEEAIHYLKGFDTSGTYPIPIFEPYSVTGGAINQKCVIQVENDLWFLNKSLQIRSLGSEAQYISDTRTNDVSLAIKRYLMELDPNQSGACMSYFKNVLKISLKTAGSPYNNWVLSYDFNNGGYSIERLHSIKRYAATPEQRFFCEDGATSGNLFKDAIGYSKNGSAYYFSGKTKMVGVGRNTINCRLRYVRVYCARSDGQELTLNVYKDTYSGPVYSSKVLAAPSSTELGTAMTTGGGWGEEGFGEEIWGGSGNILSSLAPPVYRKVFPIDQNLTGRLFGIEIGGTINGSRAEIYEIELGLIPLPEKNIYVTN
jgi:hypothetical protein